LRTAKLLRGDTTLDLSDPQSQQRRDHPQALGAPFWRGIARNLSKIAAHVRNDMASTRRMAAPAKGAVHCSRGMRSKDRPGGEIFAHP